MLARVTDEDTSLMLRVAAGDPTAFAPLVERSSENRPARGST